MHLGHGPAGAVGLATDWNQMVMWALSFATCGELASDVKAMTNDKSEVIHMNHKEESQTRIRKDHDDHQTFIKLLICVRPS